MAVVIAIAIAVLPMATSAPAQAIADASSGRFEQLRAQDLRVARVAYRLSTAHSGPCSGGTAPQLGFALHAIEQYGVADRAVAAKSYALGQSVGVMAVVEGSPAQRAGLAAGDSLESVNGRELDGGPTAAAVGRSRVDRAEAMLVEAMRSGAVTLQVAGAGGERMVRFTAEIGCASTIEFIPGSEVNAWADGARIMISEGLLRRCATDADLALVIGHEMAHNLLHHRRRLAAEGIAATDPSPSAAAATAIRATEEEADALAVRLAMAAGYDLTGAEAFVGGLLEHGATLAATHPGSGRRLALLHAAIAVGAQRAGGTVIANTASSRLVSGMM